MRILVDMDNVITDFNKAVVKEFDSYGFKRHPEKFMASYDISEWYVHEASEIKVLFNDLMEAEGFWAGLDPIPGAIEGLATLLENKHELYVVSTPWWSSPCCAIEKWQWIQANLKDLIDPFTQVIFMSQKYLVQGDLLIDDSPRHMCQWLTLHSYGIIFDCPYNQIIDTPYKYYRAKDWNRVIQILGTGKDD